MGLRATLINLLTVMWVTKTDSGEYFGVPGTYSYLSKEHKRNKTAQISGILNNLIDIMEAINEMVRVTVLPGTTLSPFQLDNQVWVEIISSQTELLVQPVVFMQEAQENTELQGKIEMRSTIVTTDRLEAFCVLVANFRIERQHLI